MNIYHFCRVLFYCLRTWSATTHQGRKWITQAKPIKILSFSVTFAVLFHLLNLFFPVSFFSNHTGGSYKKIGYYDSSQKNLSWFGNDVWIGKMEFMTPSFLCLYFCPVCLAVSQQGHIFVLWHKTSSVWLNLDFPTVEITYNQAGFFSNRLFGWS